MLADQLDYVVGETMIDANKDGYAQAVSLVNEHAPDRILIVCPADLQLQ